MKPMRCRRTRCERGTTLIEILVALVIVMVGLLGLIGVMIQGQRAQLESYQRGQALMLVQDMVARINANRAAADCYTAVGTLGTGKVTANIDTAACAVGTAEQKSRAQTDLRAWNDMLLGSAEEMAGGAQVGAILSARGCIAKDAAGVFQVSVAWQGVHATGAPPAGITCGTGTYGADDGHRRAVAITVFPYIAL